jgi:uncharacterized membrane protein YhhN
LAAAIVGAGYGVFLIVTALRLPSGAELTGQFTLQPAVKALTAVLLAVAALTHPIARERRWLIAALGHLCFLAALIPLVSRSGPRLALAAVMVLACVALLVWFGPRLLAEDMAVPVTLYIAVLGAMVCAALLARLPTPWTALGAVSDGMIGIGKFSPASGRCPQLACSEALAVPIWWAYAASLVLITAGFFFGRASVPSATPSE